MSESIRNNHTRLKQLVAATEYDLNNLLGKNTKVSATRLRAQLMQASKLCNQLRKDVLAYQKSMPTKSRKAKLQVETGDTEAESDEQPEPEEVQAPPPSPKKKTRGRKAKK